MAKFRTAKAKKAVNLQTGRGPRGGAGVKTSGSAGAARKVAPRGKRP
jgi:hypothetical protein